MFSALVVILLLAGPSLQFTLESADSAPDCSCKQISPSITRCKLCYIYEPDPDDLTEPFKPDRCTVTEGPNASCSSMRADLLALKTQTTDETKCRCRCQGDGICQCQVCPIDDMDLGECKLHEGPNLNCSSLQESADLKAHKTRTRCPKKCRCKNGAWICQVFINNQCMITSGPVGPPGYHRCPRSSLDMWSDNNYHGGDDLKAHKSLQCNCQCQNGVCQGQCCDANGCTSNPGCSHSNLELLSKNNYLGDDDSRAHKSQSQCNCQCDDDGCHGQCCDANGCTSNPGCSHSSLELLSKNNYLGYDDSRAHKGQSQCNCQCDDDGCHGQCCDANGCTSNPGCSRSSLELKSADSDPDCSCKQISPSITRCELCHEPNGPIELDTCTVSQGPNASCSSLRADLLALKTQTSTRGRQFQCNCWNFSNGSWKCKVCVNNRWRCYWKRGRGRKPAGCW